MNQKVIKLLKRIKSHILNSNAALATVVFLVMSVYWLTFALLYFLAASYTEGVLVRTDKQLSEEALTTTILLFEQTEILVTFVVINFILLGYQFYQRIGIKRTIKFYQIDVIR